MESTLTGVGSPLAMAPGEFSGVSTIRLDGSTSSCELITPICVPVKKLVEA